MEKGMYEKEGYPIEYRFWDIESKYMISWKEVQKEWEEDGYNDCYFRADHYIPMVDIGVKDKNGKYIFVGDITIREGYKDPATVRYDRGCLPYFYAHVNYIEEMDLGGEEEEIIGNIYENPELLTTNKD